MSSVTRSLINRLRHKKTIDAGHEKLPRLAEQDPDEVQATTGCVDDVTPIRTDLGHTLKSQNHVQGNTYGVVNISDNARVILGNAQGLDFGLSSGHITERVHRDLILKSLYFDGMRNRTEQIGTTTVSAETLNWIWDTDFAVWLGQIESSCYWITGQPGSGKSTLMKYIAEHRETAKMLQNEGHTWLIIHFYFDFREGKDIANNTEGMVRSLLYQIAKQCKEFISSVELHELEMMQKSKVRLAEYVEILCDYMRSAQRKICAFIDGLDEYTGSHKSLLDIILNLQMRTDMKMCLASRSEPAFVHCLSRFPHLTMQEHNANSIRRYTESAWVSTRVDSRAKLSQELSDIICQNARGNFLWARMATDELLQGILQGITVSDLRARVTAMPSEVKDMYGRIFDNLPPSLKIEAAIFLYLIKTYPSCTVRDLYLGLANYITDCGLEDIVFPVLVDDESDFRVLAVIGDYVTIQQRDLVMASPGCHAYVKYAHETIGAFFDSIWFIDHLPPDRPAFTPHSYSRMHTRARIVERPDFAGRYRQYSSTADNEPDEVSLIIAGAGQD